MTFQQFVVDVLDNSDTLVGEGPLYNVASVEITEELDRAGKVAVTVPATDERAISLLTSEYRVRVKTADGAIATGLIQDLGTIVQGQQPMFQASGPDLLGELIYLNTGYNRLYDNLNVTSAIIGTHATATSLLGGTNWTQGTVSPSIATSTVEFNAQTILQALITLAEQLGDHFRQGSTARTLDWGVFGADSGIRITNVPHALSAQAAAEATLAYVSGITVNEISADVENRLFPLGKNKFDLRDASVASANIKVTTNKGPTGASSTVASGVTAGDITVTVASGTGFAVDQVIWIGDADDWTQDHEYAIISNVAGNVLTVLNVDGFENNYSIGADVIQDPQFYVEDATSQATYGVREACPQFNWIGPVDLSADSAQQTQAADTLYAAANARLTRYSEAYQNYQLGAVFNLPTALRVGQKVRLVYKGAAKVYGGGTLFLNVDDDFYVLKIVRRFEANGKKTATLEVANTTRPTPNNENLVLYNLDTLRWIGLG